MEQGSHPRAGESQPIRVLVLSNRHTDGLLFDGTIELAAHEHHPAPAVLDELRKRSVDVTAGDVLLFPNASPGHRWVEVGGRDALARRRGWAVRLHRAWTGVRRR